MFGSESEGIERVRVQRLALLTTIEANREQHAKEVAEARKLYLEALRLALLDKLQELNAGKTDVTPTIKLETPDDHTGDYDRVLRMLRMSVDDVVELTSAQFGQYIEDDWAWKRSWSAKIASYGAYISSSASGWGATGNKR